MGGKKKTIDSIGFKCDIWLVVSCPSLEVLYAILNRIHLGESVSVMNYTRLLFYFFTLFPKQYSEIIISTALCLHIEYLKSSRDDLNYLGFVQVICKYSTILYSTGVSVVSDVGMGSWSRSPMDPKGQLY